MPRRDEYDDEDRPRRGRDDRDDGYGSPSAGGFDDRGPWFHAAKQRVQVPGTILVVLGLISTFITVIYVALLFAAPDTILRGQYEFWTDFQKNQQGAQALPPYDEWVRSQQIMSGAVGIFQLIGSVLIFLGGAKMRQLQGYGVSLTGAIMATVPLCTNQCCCVSLPFGIWALAVLLNSDVKLAFARNAAGDRDVPPDDSRLE